MRFPKRLSGIGSVAAPVLWVGKEAIAAINVARPCSRLSVGKMSQLTPEVRQAADAILQRLAQL